MENAINSNFPQLKTAANAPQEAPLSAGINSFVNSAEKVPLSLWKSVIPAITPDSFGQAFTANANARLNSNQQDANIDAYQHPTQASTASFIGNAAPTTPIMAIAPEYGIKNEAGAAMASNATQGFLVGVAQPADGWGGHLLNGGIAAATNMVLPYAANKTINTFAGNYADPMAQQVENLGKQWNVPTLASDSANTPKLNALSQSL